MHFMCVDSFNPHNRPMIVFRGYFYDAHLKDKDTGFPGGTVVKNPPANAEDMEQLSLCATITEPALYSP